MDSPQPSAPLTELAQLTTKLRPPNNHGRNGTVARLPKSLRDKLNTMMQDGVPSLKIIESLGPDGTELTETNLPNWKNGGYLDWIREQQLAHVISTKHELAESIVQRAATTDTSASQAVLQVIATNLVEFLVETDPATLRQSLLSDSDKFTRFLNSMVRLAEGAIKCGDYKFRTEDRLAEIAKRKNPAQQPGISEQSLQTAEQKLKLL